MEETLKYIAAKFNVNLFGRRTHVELPNTTRDTLADLFTQLGFTVGAEVGVERGKYSEVLLKANPTLHLYSIDAWQAYEGYRDHMTQEEMDVLFDDAKKRLVSFSDRNELIKGFSTEVAESFEDESLDFVYLDANHEFQHVVNDIAAWERKVKVGGIVAGHDYIRRKNAQFLMQVPYAIDAYVAAYEIKPLIILGRKEAKSNLDPKLGELRDSTRSWFYVKPQRAPMLPGWKQS